MFIYLFILFSLYLLGLFDINNGISNNQKRKIFYIVIFFFWILSFIRWETGTDWESYHDCFANNDTLYEFEMRGFEPFYTYLNFFIKQVTDYYWILLMICGLIIYPLTSKTIVRYSPLPFISLLVYLLLRRADIFFVRESIAIAFCFYSIRYIQTRELWKFVIYVLIGFQFHNAVIAFLPAYYIYNIDIDTKKCLYFLAGLIVIMTILQEKITSTFGQVATLLGDSFLDKTDKYLERGYDTGGATSVAAAMIRGSINRCILLAIFLYGVRKHKKGKFVKGMLNLYMTSIALFALLAPFSLTLNRIGNTYEMPAILLAGYVFDKMPHKNKKFYYLLFYTYIVIRFFMGTLYGVYSEEFLPFKTIFD